MLDLFAWIMNPLAVMPSGAQEAAEVSPSFQP